MYRDIIYTSLAKANPAFLARLSEFDRLEEFIDSFSEFAGDAHFQIEKQIIDQYTKSDDYHHEMNDIKKVNSTLRHIDENVMKLIPDLIEQALMPGSEMMEQLEREEDEIEKFETMYRQLFRDRAVDDEENGAGIILEEGGVDELRELDLPEERAETLEDFLKMEFRNAVKKAGNTRHYYIQNKRTEESSGADENGEGSGIDQFDEHAGSGQDEN